MIECRGLTTSTVSMCRHARLGGAIRPATRGLVGPGPSDVAVLTPIVLAALGPM